MFVLILLVFFFKQKTAYEVRISDWSSDVCSSDLVTLRRRARQHALREILRSETARVAKAADEEHGHRLAPKQEPPVETSGTTPAAAQSAGTKACGNRRHYSPSGVAVTSRARVQP